MKFRQKHFILKNNFEKKNVKIIFKLKEKKKLPKITSPINFYRKPF